MVALATWMAATTSRMSSRMRMTWPVSLATSVPEPMAMPTLAWARAGASFTPSPTMATTLPSSWSFFIGRAAVVAGDHGDLEAHALQLAHGPRRRLLQGVGHGDQTQRPPVGGDEHDRLAFALQPLGL